MSLQRPPPPPPHPDAVCACVHTGGRDSAVERALMTLRTLEPNEPVFLEEAAFHGSASADVSDVFRELPSLGRMGHGGSAAVAGGLLLGSVHGLLAYGLAGHALGRGRHPRSLPAALAAAAGAALGGAASKLAAAGREEEHAQRALLAELVRAHRADPAGTEQRLASFWRPPAGAGAAGAGWGGSDLTSLARHVESCIEGPPLHSEGLVADWLAVIAANAHGDAASGVGLFPALHLANHSCSPTAAFAKDATGRILLFAREHGLPDGVEVTISYLRDEELAWPRIVRRMALRGRFGFWCSCPRCGPTQVTATGSE
eukprot:gnl/TRDRNA2_/TRDRNA2_201776_c0_seq1.p1 gnl/TRDRNA2_/TRDRNA2_201776_c0~~gnl/TRDRNA2_/TRDRNA2_201776_c0_seq1.p1  ORF type:complete len:315 (+),score=45.55 gnl/TRDRNA2_/TRDRNA2_201776_c0_seq1:60-1004(+)